MTDVRFLGTVVWVSIVGAIVYSTAFLIWLSVYLNDWRSWGATGDNISIFIPLGDPK